MGKEAEAGSSTLMRPREEQRKISASILLSSHDNPGNIITQVQLRGENFDEWSRAIKTSLRAKKKHGFIDGTIHELAPQSPEYEDWWTVNSMVVSWIFNAIESGLRSTISHKELAKDLWEDITQRFSIGNGPRAHQLKAQLANCKINGDLVVLYFGRLKKSWDELHEIESLRTCTCARCSCGVSAQLVRMLEEEQLHQSLMGLDDSFGAIRSQILNTDPLPSINRAYSLAIQEESVRSISRKQQETTEAVSFVTRVDNSSKPSSRERRERNKTLLCAHCGRRGHDKDGCFQLIGFSEWWGERHNWTKGSNGAMKNKNLDARSTSTASGNTQGWAAQQANVAKVSNSSSTAFTLEQWSSILALATQHNNTTSPEFY